ncbi:MAG: adenine phosphoribosyltransferase [Flavobacteriales bacterium]
MSCRLMSNDPLAERTRLTVREIPDYPKPGIDFKDITPVLEDPELTRDLLERFKKEAKGMGANAIVGVESRGFLFGMALAIEMGIPFITVRKKGKLPAETVSYRYELEYGSEEIEMHTGSVREGMKVLVHDDLLATGGTAAAAAELVKKEGGSVAGFGFLIELSFLNGEGMIRPYSPNIFKLLRY